MLGFATELIGIAHGNGMIQLALYAQERTCQAYVYAELDFIEASQTAPNALAKLLVTRHPFPSLLAISIVTPETSLLLPPSVNLRMIASFVASGFSLLRHQSL